MNQILGSSTRNGSVTHKMIHTIPFQDRIGCHDRSALALLVCRGKINQEERSKFVLCELLAHLSVETINDGETDLTAKVSQLTKFNRMSIDLMGVPGCK